MKYRLTGKCWPLGYFVEINEVFNTMEEAEKRANDLIQYKCGENMEIQVVIG
jgi:hypothetical protein